MATTTVKVMAYNASGCCHLSESDIEIEADQKVKHFRLANLMRLIIRLAIGNIERIEIRL